MRIRKRKVPLPFHLLSPVPIPPSFFSSSDPVPTTTTPPSPLVQLRRPGGSGTTAQIPTSDDNKAAGAADFGPNRTDRAESYGSDGIGSAHPIYPISWEDGIKRSINANNVAVAARKGSKCTSSSTDPEILGQSAASHLPPPVAGAMSSWCKEYHHQETKNDSNSKSSFLVPSRKRSSWSLSSSSSASYLDMNVDPMTINAQQEIRRPNGDQSHREGTKVVHADHHNISGISESGVGGVNSNNDKKKRWSEGGRGNGGVLMEGSRCSRVNGRGWRCSQPTLVGYSLCEHHLGKGRMRSITSTTAQRPPRQLGTTSNNITTSTVASASPSTTPKSKPNHHPSLMISSSAVHPLMYSETDKRAKHDIGVLLPSSSSYGLVYDDDDEEEKKKQPQFVFPKKKSKLGTVKARSISSLLDQPENNHGSTTAVVALLAADNNHHKY